MTSRRIFPRSATTGTTPIKGAVPNSDAEPETTYKGYRIELESYCVTNSAWSPRAVVSLQNPGTSPGRTPVYSTSSVKFPTRAEADCHAFDAARVWIDSAVGPQGR